MIFRFLMGTGLILMVGLPALAQDKASLNDAPLRDAPLRDAPVTWYAQDDTPIPMPAFKEPGLVPYSMESFVSRPFSRFFNPSRWVRKIGSGYSGRPAPNVNSLDEVVNSTWFNNRIGLYELTMEDVAQGPGQSEGPDRSQPWTIIGAKTAGVTPGFRIRDGKGEVWLLKFDPPSHPGMTIRSGVVTNLIFHALGYNVPVDRVVVFDPEDLVVGEGAVMKLPRIGEVPMTAANLDSVLQSTKSVFDGHYHALASKYLSGQPLGPFNDQGRRKDDPNDTIKHQDRRELRALQVFGAWTNHFDTKMHNSLDMYVGEPGEGHVKHYLIDFASTLGAFGAEPVKRFGYEYGIDLGSMAGRFLTLGLIEDSWVPLERQEGLPEVGLLDVETFEPHKWEPDLPHSGMANLTAADGYWAAKVLSALTPEHIRAMVQEGMYSDPRAVDFLVETLCGRQNKIVRYWFDQVPPLDFFAVANDRLVWHDLGRERGFSEEETPRYRARVAVSDADRNTLAWSSWTEMESCDLDLSTAPSTTGDHPFLAVDLQMQQANKWIPSTKVYLAPSSGRVVAVDR